MSDTNGKTLHLAPVAAPGAEDRAPADQPKSGRHRVPRICLLDKFSQELGNSRGVNLTTLQALSELRITTANAVYRITVLEPFKSIVLIQGGSLFHEPTKMTLSGATLGSSFLKMSCIWIGLQMELHSGDCSVVTAPVSSIELAEDVYPKGSFSA